MSEPGRITVRHTDGRPAELPELSKLVCMTDEKTTIRLSDSPGSDRWIEADQKSVSPLGGWR